MPKMDGVELIENLRNIPKYTFIPVVMLTTERNIEKMKKAEEVKVTAWIQKPYKQDEFLKIVTKILKQT